MRKRVLIVDDDADTRHLLREFLSPYPAEVFEAGEDEEGYRKFLELGPDLLFIDVLLPRKGGLELLRRIRGVRGGKTVAAFVMSAVYRGADIRAESVDELGALDFLKKPFQFDALRQRLDVLLGGDEDEAAVIVTPFSPVEMVNRGSLAVVEFPVLFRDLALHETSGCLNLKVGRLKKVVYLKDGAVVFASSNQLRETLGRSLLEQGRIDEAAYGVGLEAMRAGGSKMGESLIEQGALDPRELHDVVRQNVMDKVLELFRWQEGDFQLGEYRDPPAVLPGPPLEPFRVLWAGIRGPYPFERIRASLRGYAEFLLMMRRDLFELAAEVPLEKEELQFLRLLRRLRGQTLSQVLEEVQGESEIRFLFYLLLREYLALGRGGGEDYRLRDLDPTELDRIRRARRRLDNLRARNHFQILQVSLDAADEQVRSAYLQLAKDSHPDMLGPADPPELRRIHEEIFQAVQTAYEALKSETRRREYLRFLQEDVEERSQDGSRILEAEARFQQGRIHLQRRDWELAAQAFEEALQWNPDEGEYALNLGIARVRQTAGGLADGLPQAEELFKRAKELMPTSAEPLFRLGRLAAQRGDGERGAEYFRAAVARNPGHVEALRELRLLKMRSQKAGRGGVLGGLLNRKEEG